MSKTTNKFLPEVRNRAMVLDHEAEHPSRCLPFHLSLPRLAARSHAAMTISGNRPPKGKKPANISVLRAFAWFFWYLSLVAGA